ncbi:MAG: hypothetical protein QM493_10730 [Sulfurovum sp.]
MEKSFKDIYDDIENSKKLSFLKQLLSKDSDLQNQFLAFTTDKKGSSLDAITAVDIDELRDELWSDLEAIDVEEELGGAYYDYDDEGMGDKILEPIFNPFVNKALGFVDKGNYLDAFRSILAIYELSTLEEPDVDDNEYFIFGEDIESFIQEFIGSAINSFNLKIKDKILSIDVVESLITIFFERYSKYLKSASDGEDNYFNIYSFNLFFEQIIDESQNAKYLLEKLKESKLDKYESSAIITLHCSDIIGDNELYLKVANEFFISNEQVALKLQKRYKELNNNMELARVSNILLEKDRSDDYALFVIDNIDKEESKSLYIKALEIYINAQYSFKHYQLLREYFTEDEKLEFIKNFESGYKSQFYIQLLEIEKKYKTILDFVEKNRDSYNLDELVEPIISIYPDEIFDILKVRSGKLVAARGRGAYAQASKLLQLILNIPTKKEELKSYISELYNHQPRLPALRDELKKAGLF